MSPIVAGRLAMDVDARVRESARLRASIAAIRALPPETNPLGRLMGDVDHLVELSIVDAPVVPCARCGAPTMLSACCWTVQRPTLIAAAELREGDRVYGAYAVAEPAVVHAIRVLPSGNLDMQVRWRAVNKLFTMRPDAPVRAGRPARCGAACCEAHLRRLGPARIVCADHWRAWEAI